MRARSPDRPPSELCWRAASRDRAVRSLLLEIQEEFATFRDRVGKAATKAEIGVRVQCSGAATTSFTLASVDCTRSACACCDCMLMPSAVSWRWAGCSNDGLFDGITLNNNPRQLVWRTNAGCFPLEDLYCFRVRLRMWEGAGRDAPGRNPFPADLLFDGVERHHWLFSVMDVLALLGQRTKRGRGTPDVCAPPIARVMYRVVWCVLSFSTRRSSRSAAARTLAWCLVAR